MRLRHHGFETLAERAVREPSAFEDLRDVCFGTRGDARGADGYGDQQTTACVAGSPVASDPVDESVNTVNDGNDKITGGAGSTRHSRITSLYPPGTLALRAANPVVAPHAAYCC